MRKWLWIMGSLFVLVAAGEQLSKYLSRNPYLSLTYEQIVDQGRSLSKKMKRVDSSNTKDLVLVTKTEHEQILAALHSIKPDAPQFAEAQQVLETLRRQGEINEKEFLRAVAKALEDNIDGRKEFARTTERDFLKNGMDVTLTLTGPKGTTLNFRYVLVSRPFLYKLSNETKFFENCRRKGFTRISFTNGYDLSATYDLIKNTYN